jgi:hypothetical protein
MSSKRSNATGANATALGDAIIAIPPSNPPSRAASPTRKQRGRPKNTTTKSQKGNGNLELGKKKEDETDRDEEEEEEDEEGEVFATPTNKAIHALVHTIPDWAEELRGELEGGNPRLEDILRLLPCLLDAWAAERATLSQERKDLERERKALKADQLSNKTKLDDFEKRLTHLQREVQSSKNRNIKADIRSTDNCLLIRGVPTRAVNETRKQTQEVVSNLLAELGVKDEVEIASAERLPAKNVMNGASQATSSGSINKNAPTIRIQLAEAKMKFTLYKALPKWRRPKELAQLRVQQEYPYVLRALNEKLEKEAYELRKKGFKTRVQLKGTTLVLFKKGRSDAEFLACE